MRELNKKSGFTLLELIVVIIIIAVLASLALPRFFKSVEFARAAEALSNLSALRNSLFRCAMRQADARGVRDNCSNLATLDVEDPNGVATRLFNYTISAGPAGTPQAPTFTLQAARVGSAGDTIQLDQAGTRTGGGTYVGI